MSLYNEIEILQKEAKLREDAIIELLNIYGFTDIQCALDNGYRIVVENYGFNGTMCISINKELSRKMIPPLR